MKRLSLLTLVFLAAVGACHGDILIDPNSNPNSQFGINMMIFAPNWAEFHRGQR